MRTPAHAAARGHACHGGPGTHTATRWPQRVFPLARHAPAISNRRNACDEGFTGTLWGSVPPPAARVTVQNYVMRLWRTLADTGKARISTQPDGYVIDVQVGEGSATGPDAASVS